MEEVSKPSLFSLYTKASHPAFCRGADLEQKAPRVGLHLCFWSQGPLGPGSWMPAMHPFPHQKNLVMGSDSLPAQLYLVLPLPATSARQSFQHGLLPRPSFWSCLENGGPLPSGHMGSIQLHLGSSPFPPFAICVTLPLEPGIPWPCPPSLP